MRNRMILRVIAAAIAIATFLYAYAVTVGLGNPGKFTGWLLFTSLVMLALFAIRKKFTYPPLLRASTWLRLHIWLGVLSLFLFALHTNLRLPGGAFEGLLYLLLCVLAASGIWGLYLSNVVPKRLTERGNEVIFERIPVFGRELRNRLDEHMQSAASLGSETLLTFIRLHLVDYMSSTKHIRSHFFGSERPRQNLHRKLTQFRRYMNEDELEIANQISELIDMKYDLDFHFVQQGLLKVWLFIHIPLTWVLMLFVLVHIVVVYSFSGSSV